MIDGLYLGLAEHVAQRVAFEIMLADHFVDKRSDFRIADIDVDRGIVARLCTGQKDQQCGGGQYVADFHQCGSNFR